MHDHPQDHTKHLSAILRSPDLILLSFPLSPPYPLRLGTVAPICSILATRHTPASVVVTHLLLCQHALLMLPGGRPSPYPPEPAPGTRRPACGIGRAIALSWALCSFAFVHTPPPPTQDWCCYDLLQKGKLRHRVVKRAACVS